MDQNYSINEILDAVEELRGKKGTKPAKNVIDKIENNDNSNIPKNTLRLIEEAEKSKNS